MFHWRSSVSVLTGALSPNVLSHASKSRFMPYLNAIEQSASRPFAWSSPLQTFQLVKLFAGHGVDDAREVGRVHDDRATRLEHRDDRVHRRALGVIQPAAWLRAAGSVSGS